MMQVRLDVVREIEVVGWWKWVGCGIGEFVLHASSFSGANQILEHVTSGRIPTISEKLDHEKLRKGFKAIGIHFVL